VHQRLNIIAGNRPERMPLLKYEIERQGIVNYTFWDAVYNKNSVKAGISEAHRQIVAYAKLAEFPDVLIAEDDFVGSHPDSFKYFLANRPSQYDIYHSMIYLGDIDEKNMVKEFTGMTMYIVHNRYYDKFLSVDPNEHIDRELSRVGGLFYVCNPFTFMQRNGFSSNTGKDENYDSLLANRNFFCGY
jgi:hypothetical protein